MIEYRSADTQHYSAKKFLLLRNFCFKNFSNFLDIVVLLQEFFFNLVSDD